MTDERQSIPKEAVAFDPDWCMRPGVHLREMMDYAGLTGDLGVTVTARLSGLDPTVIEGILNGKRRITKSIANRLACGTAPLAISAQFWLNLERQYREGLKAGKTDVSNDLAIRDTEGRYEEAKTAGKRLIDACFVAVYDPSPEKIQALREAMSRYLSDESGNFLAAPSSAATTR